MWFRSNEISQINFSESLTYYRHYLDNQLHRCAKTSFLEAIIATSAHAVHSILLADSAMAGGASEL